VTHKVKKSYPLRIHEDILTAMKHWSDDELRSLNGQIEFVLRDALCRAGRLRERPPSPIETEEQK